MTYHSEPKKVVRFNSDTKHRKQWFTGVSFSHPAKMTLPLQLWLIENFTKEGETILDPMAGSGTILVACSMGRNVIAVELEQKFVDMMKGNWAKIQERGCQMGYSMGTATILQGDARNLTGILVDKIITSPPYGELANEKKNTKSNVSREERLRRAGYNPNEFMGGTARNASIEDGLRYSHDDNNIGNLPYGQMDSLCSPQVDKIISSPPYEGSVSSDKDGIDYSKGTEYGKPRDRSKDASFQRHYGKGFSYTAKVDAVISSPPYEGTGVGDWQTGRAEFQAWVLNELATKGYIEWQGKRYTELEWRAMNHGRIDGRTTKGVHKHPTDGYGKEDGQIGNLKSDSYLSAMLQVYSQCHAVLRPGGLMILVTKNFIRNKKQVRLDFDTIKLCEQAGFTFQERWYRELSSQSFWRTIYHQKYPDVEPIKFEDILIFSKG